MSPSSNVERILVLFMKLLFILGPNMRLREEYSARTRCRDGMCRVYLNI